MFSSMFTCLLLQVVFILSSSPTSEALSKISTNSTSTHSSPSNKTQPTKTKPTKTKTSKTKPSKTKPSKTKSSKTKTRSRPTKTKSSKGSSTRSKPSKHSHTKTKSSDKTDITLSKPFGKVPEDKRRCAHWKGDCSEGVRNPHALFKKCLGMNGGCNAENCCITKTCEASAKCPKGWMLDLNNKEKNCGKVCKPNDCCRKPEKNERKKAFKVALALRKKAKSMDELIRYVKGLNVSKVRETMARVSGGLGAKWLRSCLIAISGQITDEDRVNPDVCFSMPNQTTVTSTESLQSSASTVSVSVDGRNAVILGEDDKEIIVEFDVETTESATDSEIKALKDRVSTDLYDSDSELASAGLDIDAEASTQEQLNESEDSNGGNAWVIVVVAALIAVLVLGVVFFVRKSQSPENEFANVRQTYERDTRTNKMLDQEYTSTTAL